MAKAEIHFGLKPISIIILFSVLKDGAIQDGAIQDGAIQRIKF